MPRKLAVRLASNSLRRTKIKAIADGYFSWVEIVLNLEFRLLPRPFTTAMIATEIPAAMRPYSIAVAADSSFTKRTNKFFITQFHAIPWRPVPVASNTPPTPA
jgi:hypothetical protein